MGAIGKAVNDLLGGGGDNGESAYQSSVQSIIDKINANWEVPDYDKTPLTPQEYELLNEYSPQIAAFVQQQQPALLPQNAINRGTQAQNQSLDQLSQLSKQGTDAGMQAQLEEAQMAADQTLRSNRANAIAALNNRGLGSSGATLGADIAASLGASEQQRQASLEAAAQAAQRKAQAIQQLGNLGTQVASQEQRTNEFNANTLNQYNQLLANRRQQYNQYVANTQNQANLYNQQQAQAIANANTGLTNQFNMYNREREDRNRTNAVNFHNQKLETETALQGGAAEHQLQATQQQLAGGTAGLQGLLGIAGAGIGAYFGGPAGAAAGYSIGNQISQTNQGSPGYQNANGEYLNDSGDTGGGYVTDYNNGPEIDSAIA